MDEIIEHWMKRLRPLFPLDARLEQTTTHSVAVLIRAHWGEDKKFLVNIMWDALEDYRDTLSHKREVLDQRLVNLVDQAISSGAGVIHISSKQLLDSKE